MIEFKPFPKVARWANNKVAITEKIDGTNALVSIMRCSTNGFADDPTVLARKPVNEFDDIVLRAGSRTRWITPEKDNYRFAAWVAANAAALLGLGEGDHYGEWWGNGIQRGYGLESGDKRFSLFNVGRWIETPNGIYDGDSNPDKQPINLPGLYVVPTLYYGPIRDASGTDMVEECNRRLQFGGSIAAPGFKNPEGSMVYFDLLKTYAKAPLDPAPKGQG